MLELHEVIVLGLCALDNLLGIFLRLVAFVYVFLLACLKHIIQILQCVDQTFVMLVLQKLKVKHLVLDLVCEAEPSRVAISIEFVIIPLFELVSLI